jgi:hypothetical protein
MQDMKAFRKAIRLEIGHLCDNIKRLEFMASRLRGPMRREIRRELAVLKRFRDHVLRRIRQLRLTGKPMCVNTAQRIKEEIARMRGGCHALEAQLR